MKVDLAGKTALVTGATSGIGRRIALEVAAAGATVHAVGRDQARLRGLVAESAGSGAECRPVVADLTDTSAIADVLGSTVGEGGSLDVLVHSAGICGRAPFEETTPESLEAHWRINVAAPLELTRQALPALRRARGTVLFVSSIAARGGLRNLAAYSASKGAVEALTRALALELAPSGVRVNAVAPGFIETPMNEQLRREGAAEEWAISVTPAGRIGTDAEVARAAAFLVSEAASYIYGAVVPVDGGYPAVPPPPAAGEAPASDPPERASR